MYGDSYEYYDGHYSQEPRKPHKVGKLLKKGAALLLSGVVFGSAAAAAFYGVNSALPETATETAAVASAETTAATEAATTATVSTVSATSDGVTTSQSLDVSDIASGVMPAMVAITNQSVEEVQSYFGFYGTQTQEVTSSGTGIIIGQNDTELLIVTNYHVIEGAQTISVCFIDEQAASAVVKGSDSDNDLAIVSVALSDVSESTLSQIKIATLGDSDALSVGEQVVAIGNALGYGQSVTTGIVSALNRQVDATDAVMIQTDAAINPGNSGGALVNMNGEIIGINSAKFSSTDVEGMGYAIAISAVKETLEDLMNRTTRQKVSEDEQGYLGINGQDISESVAEAYNMTEGIYLTSVTGPAAVAGLERGQILTHFDGTRVKTLSELKSLLEYYAAGETVEVTVCDTAGNETTVSVTLGSAEDAQQQTAVVPTRAYNF